MGDILNNEFKFKKSLGQNFLKDNHIINKIIDCSDIDKDTLVIEIGPGQGALSRSIVEKAKAVILYEIDIRLNWYLNRLLKRYDNYEIIIGDFLKTNLKSDLKKYNYNKLYVISNLPYYITTPIINKFIDDDILPDRMVLMIQKEVANRFSARVNSRDYGSLTVLLNYYYNINKLFDVSRNSFYPKPRVDSAVICMDLKKNRKMVKNISVFKRLIYDSFRFKRKNLKNNLGDYDLNKIKNILLKYNLDLSCRAENLSLDIFVEIANDII